MKHLCLVAMVVCVVGCAGTSGTQARSVAITGPEGETDYSTYISADNSRLARRMAVVRFDRADIGGLLRAAVTLQSRTSDTEAIQYKWTWFDSKGFEVSSSAQPWQPLLVYGMQTTSVQGLAPNPSVKDFKLHLRYQQ